MPDPEALWLDLLNSDWHDYLGSGRREDRLEDAAWLDRYLSVHGIDAADVPRVRLVAALRELRQVLRRIADRYAQGEKPSAADWETLNRYFARAPLIRKVALPGTPPYPRLSLVPVSDRFEFLLAEIARAFVETLARGEPSRLKICGNPDCHWVFFDHSKNTSRRWCEDTCGNLMKVRRFRARKRRAG